jgi:DNA-binding NtrC family response regulator
MTRSNMAIVPLRLLAVAEDLNLLSSLCRALYTGSLSILLDAASTADTGRFLVETRDYDAIISDVGMSGFRDFLGFKRINKPNTPVLVVLAQGSRCPTQELFQLDPLAFRVERVESESILPVIRRAIHRANLTGLVRHA